MVATSGASGSLVRDLEGWRWYWGPRPPVRCLGGLLLHLGHTPWVVWLRERTPPRARLYHSAHAEVSGQLSAAGFLLSCKWNSTYCACVVNAFAPGAPGRPKADLTWGSRTTLGPGQGSAGSQKKVSFVAFALTLETDWSFSEASSFELWAGLSFAVSPPPTRGSPSQVLP